MATDVAIVGRGIAGLAAGFRFALAGCRVAVIGPRALPGSATVVAQGLMVSKGLVLARDPLYALKLAGQRGLDAWLRLIETHSNQPIPRLLQGALEPFWSEDEYRYLRERIYKSDFDGFSSTTVLSREELAKKPGSKFIRPGAIGAFFYAFDGWFDPQATLVALEIAIKKLGGIFIDAPCERIEFAQYPRIVLQRAEPLAANDVILAAGFFSQALMLRSGLDHSMLRAVHGQNLSFLRRDGQKPANPVVHGRHSLVTTDRLHILGSTSTNTTWSVPDQSLLMSSHRELATLGTRFSRFSEAELASVDSQWGLRLNTTDRRPMVGFLPLGDGKRIGFLTGLYKNGLQIADICAKELVAAHAQKQHFLSSIYAPERFFRKS